MATNLAIDDKLIVQAQRAGRFKTKRDAVTQALKEYIARHQQNRILDLAGKVDYYPDYNPRKYRDRA